MRPFAIFFFVFSSLILASPLPDYQFISPLPGSLYNSREATIIIRHGEEIDAACLKTPDLIAVSGSLSGEIPGKIILSTDGKTVIFEPATPFAPSETVTVRLNSFLRTRRGEKLPSFEYSFVVTALRERLNPRLYLSDEASEPGYAPPPQNASLDTLPGDFPSITTEVLGETAPGFVFLTVSRDIPGVGYYLMMLNNDGTPFYYKNLPDDYAYDFKIQPNGLFSYAQFLEHHAYTGGGDVIHMVMDHRFTVVDSFQMGNGYIAESHDFQLLPNGHALLFGYDLQLMDLTHLGGYPNALVAGTVVQELDRDKNVVFQWRSWDHYQLEDSYWSRWDRSAFDPIHVNSIELDHDGHILITPNGLSEVTKINRQTGDIIWRLGGKNNQFTFVGANAEFSRGIHNVDRLPGGTITLFDNTPVRSSTSGRAVEYELDEENFTATLVWEYVPDPAVIAVRRGSVQRLPNGNTLIGWGSASDDDSLAVTEVTPTGEVVFQLYFNHQGLSSYRAFRFAFNEGAPSAEVTQYEVVPGNTYSFSEDDSSETGVEVKIDQLSGEGYNELTVTHYNFAPLKPEFPGKAPRVVPRRVVLSQVGIQAIAAEVRFDADFYNIDRPAEVIVYHREFENQGLFVPLSTSYNPVTGQIIAAANKFGEFILAKPDLEAQAFAPQPFAPADFSLVNQTLPLALRWTPVGYVNSYTLQVARDAGFSDIIVDESLLKEALFELESLAENTTYFWRVKALNPAGESDWSEMFMFTATAPFVALSRPNGGEAWQRGLPYFIQWTDNLEENVVVELHKADSLYEVLDTTASNGAYRWEIDFALETASDYSIKIKSLRDDALFDASEQFFTVMDTTISAINDLETMIGEYRLYQNYPNPFNPLTHISFDLPRRELVTITVYDVRGRQVAMLLKDVKTAGSHEIAFNAAHLASGLYIYKLQTPSFSKARKMILLR